ncbi:tetratricopeptide repeat protein [Kovacikia minuta CCNUW1]|uniref:tetratricopeptide repeat protein n=1 Tax=Kovacikia minuta TaxID=2931930 RepID=UPI001CCC8D6D|nr:tetratricopeptide repeat protein [Kovacikia minuta]UBF26048.1 tetratricopeptide repeat protein [Kovacikia minuta CCNUW1]
MAVGLSKMTLASPIALQQPNLSGQQLDATTKQMAEKGNKQVSLLIAEEEGDRKKQALIYERLGENYFDLEDNAQALTSFTNALELFRDLGDQKAQARILNRIGRVYYLSGEPEKASERYNEALQLLEKDPDQRLEATIRLNIGLLFADKGAKDFAARIFYEALQLARKIDYHEVAISAVNGIVQTLFDAPEDYQNALNIYEQLLKEVHASGDQFGEAIVLNNIGRRYALHGDHQQALNRYDAALSLLRTGGYRREEALILSNIALEYRNQGDLKAALKAINAATSIIGELRNKISSKDLRTSFFSSLQAIYQFKIDLLMQMGREAEALETADRTRARTLIELLTESRADIHKGISEERRLEGIALQQKLNARETERSRLFTVKSAEAQISKVQVEEVLSGWILRRFPRSREVQ